MRSLLSFVRPLSIVAVAVFAFACGPEPAGETPADKDPVDDTPAEIEVAGDWESQFGDKTTISSSKWGVSTVVKYDNDNNWAVVQMPADDEWNPSKFAKIVWTEIAEDSFCECWVTFGQEAAADAETTTETADSSDPEESGCGGFSWTKMTMAATDA